MEGRGGKPTSPLIVPFSRYIMSKWREGFPSYPCYLKVEGRRVKLTSPLIPPSFIPSQFPHPSYPISGQSGKEGRKASPPPPMLGQSEGKGWQTSLPYHPCWSREGFLGWGKGGGAINFMAAFVFFFYLFISARTKLWLFSSFASPLLFIQVLLFCLLFIIMEVGKK